MGGWGQGSQWTPMKVIAVAAAIWVGLTVFSLVVGRSGTDDLRVAAKHGWDPTKAEAVSRIKEVGRAHCDSVPIWKRALDFPPEKVVVDFDNGLDPIIPGALYNCDTGKVQFYLFDGTGP